MNLLDFSGAACIDGVPVNTVPHDFLRSRVITLPQEGIELCETVRDNLDPFSEAPCLPSDETLFDILRRVGLAHFIEQHGGLDAKLIDDQHVPRAETANVYRARYFAKRDYIG